MGSKWKKHRDSKNQQRQTEKGVRTLGDRIWRGVISFSVISGIFVTLYALAPKLIIIPSTERLDMDNPLSTLFTVTNDGLLPIYSVKFLCELRNIETAGHTVLKNSSRVLNKQDRSELNPGQSASFQCSSGVFIGENIAKANISVDVSFRQAYWFMRHERKFAFTGSISTDGTLHWLPSDYET